MHCAGSFFKEAKQAERQRTWESVPLHWVWGILDITLGKMSVEEETTKAVCRGLTPLAITESSNSGGHCGLLPLSQSSSEHSELPHLTSDSLNEDSMIILMLQRQTQRG